MTMKSDIAALYTEKRLPRYTSYPTAPQFSSAISAATYAEWLEALAPDLTASLYLHIPFCQSMCWYCGCHTTITHRQEPIVRYLATLRREIALVAEKVEHPLPVCHVHFGGGTPTIMTPEAFYGLAECLNDRFSFTPQADIAVEIDPRTLTAAMASTLGQAGVTRASLGIQTLDGVVQSAVNRVQSFDEIAFSTEALRAAGIRGINFDLIYGLPHQTVASCVETVRRCLTLRPDRIAVFGYAHVPGFKKHQRKINEAALADGSGRLAQAKAIGDLLTQAGYVPIGMDHYALPGDEMAVARSQGRLRRNFQGYTTDQSDVLIGFGASAIGRLTKGYVQNEVALPRYAERIARGEFAVIKGYALTRDDHLRAEIIERLMCDFRVDVGRVCRKHGMVPETLLAANSRLQTMAADGLIQLDGSVVSVTDEARFLVRSIASVFDAYFGSSDRPQSRAV